MKRTSMLLAASLAATAVAAPAALAHGDGPARAGDGKPANVTKVKATPGTTGAKRAPKRVRPVTHLVHACVTADGTATGVDTRVLTGNRNARRALDGATALSVKIDDKTRIRLVGKAARAKVKTAQHRARGWQRWVRRGEATDLKAGDRVVITIRAPRGTAAAALPAASRIVDLGQSRRCTTPAPAPQPQPQESAPAPAAS